MESVFPADANSVKHIDPTLHITNHLPQYTLTMEGRS
jgi:hypothetical protein